MDKLSIVKQLLPRIPFLNDNGFRLLSESVEHDQEVRDLSVFVFSSDAHRKKIEFHFFQAEGKLPDTFNVYLLLDGKNINIKQYLINQGVVNNKKPFLLSSYKGNFEEKLRGFIFFLSESFSSNWSQLLLTDKWLDVPVDWGDYK